MAQIFKRKNEMITTAFIILYVFAMCYILFSVCFLIVFWSNSIIGKKGIARCGILFGTILIAPIVTPVILGTYLGIKTLKE